MKYLIALLIAWSGAAFGATVPASSCSQADVQAAVNTAVNADTVTVPSGTCTWAAAVSITNKTILLVGAGSGVGGTHIQHDGTGHSLIVINAGTQTGRLEVSGFKFSGDAPDFWDGTAMNISGPIGWKNLRIHGNVFEGTHPWTMRVYAPTHGLIDSNTFTGNAFGIIFMGRGKKDWSTPLRLGTADFFFVENNIFDWGDFYAATGAPTSDMNNGGRVVFRNNTVTNGMWETHDRARSGLVSANAYEVYNNTFIADSNKWKGLDVSAGTGVIWGNTFTGDWTVPIGAMDYKTADNRGIPVCDGNDPDDQNVAGQTGWRCQYQIGSMGEGPAAYGYPIYVWSNTKNGAATSMSCTAGCSHLVAGRDFINNGTTAKPGYTPYTYPHPLRAP